MNIELIIDENGHKAFSIDQTIVAYDESDPVHSALLTMVTETLKIKHGANARVNERTLEYIQNMSPGAVTGLIEFFRNGPRVSVKHQINGDNHAA